MKEKIKSNYIDVKYNLDEKPITTYPSKLSKYLFDRFNLKKGQKLLDIGCGRGDFLKGFIDCGLEGYAVDRSDIILRYFDGIKFKESNIEEEGIPYQDNMFDVVYSKSVIEHFHNPDKLLQEMFRVLKPGGLAITLCPSWEYNYKIYFQDYTHRTPFMRSSLRDIQLINGFEDVNVEFFIQLPIIWKNKWLKPISALTNKLVPDLFKEKFKWVKWSKEIMLLSTSIKPS